jgi:hypothetical protein
MSAPLRARIERLVQGLVDQQAMPDAWWQPELAAILAALSREEPDEPAMPITGIHDEFGRDQPTTVPMWMLRPWAAQAEANHGQTLGRLRERGGLSAAEAVAILTGASYQAMMPRAARNQLARLTHACTTYRAADRLRLEIYQSGLQAIYTTARGDEKGECWTLRRWLDAHGLFNDDIQSPLRLIEEACKALLAPK